MVISYIMFLCTEGNDWCLSLSVLRQSEANHIDCWSSHMSFCCSSHSHTSPLHPILQDIPRFFSKEKPMFEAPSRRPLASWHWIDGTRTCAEMHIVHEAAVPCGDGCLQEMAVRGTTTEGGFLWCRCSYSMIHPIHVTCVASSSQCLTTQRWFKSWKSLSHLSQADIDGCGKTNDSDHNKKNGRCLSN